MRRAGHCEIYAQRGYARNLQHISRGAMADWEIALQRGLPPDQARNVRLSLADAALAAKDPSRALRALQKLPVSYDTAIRRAYALQALDRRKNPSPNSGLPSALARRWSSATKPCAPRSTRCWN